MLPLFTLVPMEVAAPKEKAPEAKEVKEVKVAPVKPAPKKEVPNFANIQVAVKPLAPKAGTASLFGKKAPAGSPFVPKAKTNPFAVKPKASPFPPKPVTTPVTAPATNTAAPVQPAPQTETVPVGQVSLS